MEVGIDDDTYVIPLGRPGLQKAWRGLNKKQVANFLGFWLSVTKRTPSEGLY